MSGELERLRKWVELEEGCSVEAGRRPVILFIFFSDAHITPYEEKVVQGRVIEPETPSLEDKKE